MPNITDLTNGLLRAASTATAATLQTQVATIVSADPIHQIYEALPVGVALTDINKIKAIPLNAHTNIWGGVQAHRIYRQGDIVLLAISPTNLFEGSQLLWGVILGTINAAKFKYVNRGLSPEKPRIPKELANDYSRFYEDLNKIYSGKGADQSTGFYLPGLERSAGGDFLVRGEYSFLRVSESESSMGAWGASISIGGESEALVTKAATAKQTLLGFSDTRRLVNGDSYLEHYQAIGSKALLESSQETRGILTQAGSVPYGLRTSVIVPGAALSTVDQRLDGQIRLNTVNGFISDKIVSPCAYRDKYKGLVIKDSTLNSDIDNAKDKPFQAAAKSPNWDKICKSFVGVDISGDSWLYDTVNDMTSSYFCEYPTASVEDSNSAGDPQQATQLALCASRIAQCPDGSIILRDAWGSEIRLSNGDVQISAARKMVFISSDDVLTMIGGVLSINCGNSINIGSQRDIDVVATGTTNIAGSSAVLSYSKDVTIHSDSSIQLSSLGAVGVAAPTISTNASHSLDLLSNNAVTIYGKTNASLASTASYVAVGSSLIELAANNTNVISGLYVSEGKTTHKLGADTTGVSAGSGIITATGSIRSGAQIVANSGIISAGSVIANSVLAKSVNPYIGVFKVLTSPKRVTINAVDAKYAANGIGQTTKSLLQTMANYTLKSLRKKIYEVTKKAASNGVRCIIRPLFSRKVVGRAVVQPQYVENDTGNVYIYPGEQFWTDWGMLDLTPREVEDIQVRQELKTSGAINLSFTYQGF